jgi:hypothetical protein
MTTRDAPTLNGDTPAGPSAWAVPVVPNSTAAISTYDLATTLIVAQFHNTSHSVSEQGT